VDSTSGNDSTASLSTMQLAQVVVANLNSTKCLCVPDRLAQRAAVGPKYRRYGGNVQA
jgi:hypothetical protein